jgi:ribonuclease P protein component
MTPPGHSLEPSGGCEPVLPGLYAFPKNERLTCKKDFEYVFKQGVKHVGKHFVCYSVRQEAPGRRMGMAVSRKVGKAVVRNRVKRYVREFYRHHRGRILDNFWLVVVARPSCAALTYDETTEALSRLISREGALAD